MGDRDRVLSELPIPLRPEADLHDALAVAVAVEDGCGVTLPDHLIAVEHLHDRAAVEATLRLLEAGP